MPAQRADKLHVMLHHHDGRALRRNALQPRLQLLGFLRVEAGRRLVQQQHIGAAEQRAGDFDLLLHPVRQVVGLAGGELRQTDPFQRFQRLAPPPRAAHQAQRIQHVGEAGQPRRLPEHHIFQHRQMRQQTDVLETPRHPAAHAQARRDVGDVAPAHADAPGGDRIDAADEIEHGGFAGAVRADERGALAARHAERQILHHLQAAERFGDAVQG